jgi:hypothetical protein
MGEREIARGITEHIMRQLDRYDASNGSDQNKDVVGVRESAKDS